jgi:hypothetical protein
MRILNRDCPTESVSYPFSKPLSFFVFFPFSPGRALLLLLGAFSVKATGHWLEALT